LRQLSFRDLERQVLLAVEADPILDPSIEEAVVRRERAAVRIPHVRLVQPVAQLLPPGTDLPDELEIDLLPLRIVGLGGHRDVAAGPFFRDPRGEFAGVPEAPLESL